MRKMRRRRRQILAAREINLRLKERTEMNENENGREKKGKRGRYNELVSRKHHSLEKLNQLGSSVFVSCSIFPGHILLDQQVQGLCDHKVTNVREGK